MERVEVQQGEPGDDIEDLYPRRGTRRAAGAPHNEKQNADKARSERQAGEELVVKRERRSRARPKSGEKGLTRRTLDKHVGVG